MKKIIFISLSFLLCSGSSAFTQETFNIFSFPAPGNMITEPQGDKLAVKNVIDQAIIVLCPVTKGFSNPVLNFNSDWRDYVVTGNRTLDLPHKKQGNTINGWQSVSGQSRTIINGTDYWVQLYSFTKEQQKAAIVFIARDVSVEQKISGFIAQLTLMDRPAPSSPQLKDEAVENAQPGLTGKKKTPNDQQPVSAAGSFGNMEFNLPEGWNQLPGNGYLKILPAGLHPQESYYIELLPPLTGEQDMKNALQQTWEQISNREGIKLSPNWRNGPSAIIHTIQGFDCIKDYRDKNNPHDLNTEITLFLVKTNTGIERMAIYDQQFRAAETQGLYMKYSALTSSRNYYQAYDFIASLQFKQKAMVKDITAQYKHSKITGVWCGLEGSYQAVTGGYQLSSGYFVLLDNGIAYNFRTPPQQGLYHYHPYTGLLMLPDFWGDYTYNNTGGQFKNLYYGNIDFSISNDKMKLVKNKTAHTFIKLPDFDNARFSGTYAFKSGESISFTADGHFTDNGVLDIINHSTQFKPYHITYAPGGGSYRIVDYSIVFRYDDGRVFQTAFCDYSYNPSNPSPPLLHLGWHLDELELK